MQNEKTSSAKMGALSVAATGALIVTNVANAKAVVKTCQRRLALGDDEIGGFAEQLDPKTIPTVIDPSSVKCDNLKLLPTAAFELKNDIGELSPGSCQALKKQMAQIEDGLKPNYEVDLKKCDQAAVEVAGSKIGEIVQVDAAHFYFDIPPVEGGFGTRFQIQYNGGVDFDPQDITCYRLINGTPQTVESCGSTIKGAVLGGSGFAYSLAGGREKLFNSKKICRTINSDLARKPFCTFADNSHQIRQAFSSYASKCFREQQGRSGNDTTNSEASAR